MLIVSNGVDQYPPRPIRPNTPRENMEEERLNESGFFLLLIRSGKLPGDYLFRVSLIISFRKQKKRKKM